MASDPARPAQLATPLPHVAPGPTSPITQGPISRRELLRAGAGLAAVSALAAVPFATVHGATSRGFGPLKVGVIGCGGRGTGAAVNNLEASPDTIIWALGDVFPDRLAGSREELAKIDAALATRVQVTDDRAFSGFDAYQKVIASGVDVVILATPPHFRPIHLAAAVAAGKHVFMEKPVATDPAGVRSVLASAAEAKAKGLSIVTGTQRRHEASYLEAMQRLRDGAIGRVVAVNCYWNQGGLWMHKRRPEWTDMEWQLRNWLYFTWLSGDHIVEQHVHNIDVANWGIGAVPERCTGLGGRQVRTSPDYGHVFDHFAIQYDYAAGDGAPVTMTSMCRQIEGTSNRVEEVFFGTEGVLFTQPGQARIEGKNAWKFTGKSPNPYMLEHKDLMAAIAAGTPINEARRIAESTLTAIMGRMSAYTGKNVSWQQALDSKLDLAPTTYELGDLPAGPVAVPGKTPLV